MAATNETKRLGKTEVLSMRIDPKTRFLLEVLTRLRGQSISTVVERAIVEAADRATFGYEDRNSWRDLWHVNDGIRSLKMASDAALYPTFDDEYVLDFCKTHWPFFYNTKSCTDYKEWSIEILWPRIQEFMEIWSKTKATDYFAAGKAMQKAISAAGVKAPDWPTQVAAPSNVGKTPATTGAPSWDAPKGGDLDDEIPF